MNCFSIGRTETSAYIQSFEYVPSTGIPKFSLVIENDFTYKAFHHGVKCNIATLSANRIYTLNQWFSTGVPRNPRVLPVQSRGSATLRVNFY